MKNLSIEVCAVMGGSGKLFLLVIEIDGRLVILLCKLKLDAK